MHDDVAARQVFFEHSERIAAKRLEILLNLDLDVRPRERAAQVVAIVAELIRNTEEKTV